MVNSQFESSVTDDLLSSQIAIILVYLFRSVDDDYTRHCLLLVF